MVVSCLRALRAVSTPFSLLPAATALLIWPTAARAQDSSPSLLAFGTASAASGEAGGSSSSDPKSAVPDAATKSAVTPLVAAPGAGSDTLAVSEHQPIARDPQTFQRFDALRHPMLTTEFPGLYDTVTGDLGGWRSWLADHDAVLEIQTTTDVSTNLLPTSAPRSPQVYNGQRPTLQVHSTNFSLSVGLDQLGLGDTRINAIGGYLRTSFDPNGPDQASFRELSLYHGFHDRTVEVEVGFVENFLRYAGLFGGGNPILTTGLGSLIPIQVGMSAEPAPTPGINIAVNGRKGLYVKAGVQRSENPLGLEAEVRNEGVGLDWSQPGARALYIGEVGIRRKAAPGQRSLWLRAGYIYNSSRYQRFLGGTGTNRSFYILGDYQLTRPDSRLFFRGLYVGGSYASAPKDVNVYSRSAEARAYYIGPLSSRPTDALNVTLTYNEFSADYHAANLPLGVETERRQFGTSVAYAIQAAHGIHVSPTLQYLVHPTVAPGYRNALVGALSIYVLW